MSDSHKALEDGHICSECFSDSHNPTLDEKLDNLLSWDFNGVKEPLIFADPMRTAIKKLVADEVVKELERHVLDPDGRTIEERIASIKEEL